jgi:hypothetical protein
MAELPALSVAERQAVIRRAVELDERGLSSEDEAIVEKRLAEHRHHPGSALELDEIKNRLRSRATK